MRAVFRSHHDSGTGPFRVLRLVAVALAVLAAGGCGGGPEVLTAPDGAHVIVAGSRDGGMDARLDGVLAVLSSDCVGIDVDGTEYLVAWPAGTSIGKGDDLRLVVGDDDYAVGDKVAVSGGSVQVAETSGLPDLPASCEADEIFVVNR